MRLLRVARFHRVQGLVWSSLSNRRDEMPAEVAEGFAADATYIAAASLRASNECSQLARALERAQVPHLFLKGLALGTLAYRNPALKAAADVDLLVAPGSIEDVAALLKDRGFELEIPSGRANPARIGSWHRRRKESLWVRPGDGLAIDLHTQVSDNISLIPSVGVQSPRQDIDVGRTTIPTLATDELFAYLCVHGASSAWFRLKWITDFAALIHVCSSAEIERLYERSQELGAYRAADQALLLANALYGSLEGSNLKPQLLSDRTSRTLFEAALRQLSTAEEPTEAMFGTWRIHWTQLLLKPGLAFKVSEASRQIRDAIF
jgi:hypothetical protein